MNRRRVLAAACAAALSATTIFGLMNTVGAIPVFDSSNYAQNVVQAARALAQINNQIQSLQHETVMLQNMALNLKRLDYSSLNAITAALHQVDGLMLRAQGIAFDVGQPDAAFRLDYPDQYAAAVSTDKLVLDARSRWRNSMLAYRHTLNVQAQVAQNVQADSAVLGDLVAVSQNAEGSLQAQQATNQLLALSTKQQLQIQNMMAAQYRAEALEQARAAEAQEQSRATFQKFLGSGSAYSPR